MRGEVSKSPGAVSLRDSWGLRNAATATVVKAEEQFRRLLQSAGVDEVVALLEAFAPARSPGPDWSRSFDPLVERLWLWCRDETLAAVEAQFRARGAPWLAVANSLAPDHGAELRSRLVRRSAQARLPALTLE